jgi:hypothetical protein
MKRALLAVVLVAGLTGCAGKAAPQRVLGVGGRAIYTADEFSVISVCDQGNLVYLTGRGDGGIAVVPKGCLEK